MSQKYAICTIGLLGVTVAAHAHVGSYSSTVPVRANDNTSVVQSPLSEHRHRELLTLITSVLNVLKETKAIKCRSDEETTLVNQIFAEIKRGFGEYQKIDELKDPTQVRAISARKNHAIACMLRTIVQVYGISSPELDAAKGAYAQEETDIIIRELQKCLAQRNISSINKAVRAWTDAINPYHHILTAVTVPVVGFFAYSALNMMKSSFVSLAGSDRRNTGAAQSAHESWHLFAKIALIPAGALAYTYAETISKDAFEKISDAVKRTVAKLQGKPYSGSNPASASKNSLKAVPAPQCAKEHMAALSRMLLHQEAVYLQGGGAGLKSILIHGDTGLALLLAQGLAHEVTRLAKEEGKDMTCPVATIHLSKLVNNKEALKTELEKITRYNKACIIVLQEVDCKVADETCSAIVAQIISGIKSVTKLHENYIIIGTARNLNDVHNELKSGTIFGTKLALHLTSEHRDVIDACFKRAEDIYGITITDGTLRESLEMYLCKYSFTSFMNLFAAAYTKALPQIGTGTLTQDAIARELSLATT